jgi:hypothetical protein
MATAVIGGIIVSTVLSLVVVPSFFLIMDDLQRLLGRVFGGLVGRREPEPEQAGPEALRQEIAETRAALGTVAARLEALEAQRAGAPLGKVAAAE